MQALGAPGKTEETLIARKATDNGSCIPAIFFCFSATAPVLLYLRPSMGWTLHTHDVYGRTNTTIAGCKRV